MKICHVICLELNALEIMRSYYTLVLIEIATK
jgi:hypothetical protein